MIKFIEEISAKDFSWAKVAFFEKLHDAGYVKSDIFSWDVDVVTKVVYNDEEPIDVIHIYKFEVVIRVKKENK